MFKFIFSTTVLLGSTNASSSATAPTSQGFKRDRSGLLPSTDGLGTGGQVLPAQLAQFGTGNVCLDMKDQPHYGGTVIVNEEISMESICMDAGQSAFWDHRLINVIFDKEKCWQFCRGSYALSLYERSCNRWCEKQRPILPPTRKGGSKGLTISPDVPRMGESQQREIYMPDSQNAAMAKRDSAIFAEAAAREAEEQQQNQGGLDPRTSLGSSADLAPAAAPMFKANPNNQEAARGFGDGKWCLDKATGIGYPDGEEVVNAFLCRRQLCSNGVLTEERTCNLLSWRQCWEKCSGIEMVPECETNYCRKVDSIWDHAIFKNQREANLKECQVPWTGQNVSSNVVVKNKLQCREIRCLDGTWTDEKATCRVKNRRKCTEQCSGPYSTLPNSCFDYCARVDRI